MRFVKDKKGETHKVPDTVVVNENALLEYVRAWTIGDLNKEGKYAGVRIIYECPDGSFREQSGKLITDKKQFKGMPKDHHYERALKWLEDQKVVDQTEPQEIN